jgi:DnaJ-class molecular chaperone
MTEKKPDLYAVLGLEKTATAAEIKTAVHKNLKGCHPDTYASDQDLSADEREQKERRYKDVDLAKEILTDPTKRAAYDRGGHAALDPLADNYGPRPGARAPDFSDLMAILARAGIDIQFASRTSARPQPVAPNPDGTGVTFEEKLKNQGSPIPGENSATRASVAPKVPVEIINAEAQLARAKAVLDSVPLDVLTIFREKLLSVLDAIDRRIEAVKPQPRRPPKP